ncbi:DUF6082 family protein [Actinoplanes sp. L3-i22]|uniref:DUF6082 family protein n=1 Tax=Actinoplanes sp. L3-i22 TaxID=2836373 RepID=UPI001C78E90A|nr:DUF6082 family protein [Actinoplanes sp. L3-i22]BCY09579.1 hypothetical protein L3i22_046670 [Actinoplanes sp. L3-i22]
MGTRRRVTVYTLVTIALGTALCAGLSPLALAAVGDLIAEDWVRLGNIGQAYGAASAIFSALALAGVTASLVYQARSVGQHRVQAVREQHADILNMICADPETYAPALNRELIGQTPLQVRRHVFLGRAFRYYAFGYATEVIAEADLRLEIFPEVFGTEPGRTFWAGARTLWLNSGNPDYRRLARVADAEYRKAVEAGPPQVNPDPGRVPPHGHPVGGTAGSHRRNAATAATVVAGALLAGWLTARSRERPRRVRG